MSKTVKIRNRKLTIDGDVITRLSYVGSDGKVKADKKLCVTTNKQGDKSVSINVDGNTSHHTIKELEELKAYDENENINNLINLLTNTTQR